MAFSKSLRRFFLSSILGFICFINSGFSISSGSHTVDNYYYLSVTSKNTVATFGLNDAPLVIDDEGYGIRSIEPVNAWLMPGTNFLTVRLHPLSDESGKYSDVSLDVKVFLHDTSFEVPTPKTTLMEYRYPDPNQEKGLPFSDSAAFEFSGVIPTKLWNDSEKNESISLNDKKEIIDLINQLETSLINNNVSEAIKLQHYKIVDDALSQGKTLDQLKNAARKGYEILSQQSGLKGSALTLDAAKFEFCCNNQVVYVSNQSGEDAIQIESDDLYFDVPVFVSKIDGQWLIVR